MRTYPCVGLSILTSMATPGANVTGIFVPSAWNCAPLGGYTFSVFAVSFQILVHPAVGVIIPVPAAPEVMIARSVVIAVDVACVEPAAETIEGTALTSDEHSISRTTCGVIDPVAW